MICQRTQNKTQLMHLQINFIIFILRIINKIETPVSMHYCCFLQVSLMYVFILSLFSGYVFPSRVCHVVKTGFSLFGVKKKKNLRNVCTTSKQNLERVVGGVMPTTPPPTPFQDRLAACSAALPSICNHACVRNVSCESSLTCNCVKGAASSIRNASTRAPRTTPLSMFNALLPRSLISHSPLHL